ncbi:MAG: hypothetical protein WCB68_16695 [Pyrinomonadaceae bacterium]
MSRHPRTAFPPMDAAYTDEFGRIEPDVYSAASAIWGRCEQYALGTLGDAPAGLRLLLKSAAIVTRRRSEPDTQIANLTAYLFQVYKRLVLAEAVKEQEHRQRERDIYARLTYASESPSEKIDRQILVEEVMQRMDNWMREVFELLVLGHTFEEIGKLRRQNAHALRTKFNKHLKRLLKQINP